MAHHKSAIKRIRRNNSASVRNNQYATAVRTAVKKFRLAVTSAAAGTIDKGIVAPLFLKAQSLLSKAANKGVLHPNNASRKVGRLAALLKKFEEGKIVIAAVSKPGKKVVKKDAPAVAAAPAAAAAPKAKAAPKPKAKAAAKPKADKK